MQHCKWLTHLYMGTSDNFTDQSLIAIATVCPNIDTLNIGGCRRITQVGLLAVAGKCALLRCLTLDNIANDVSVIVVASGGPAFSSLIVTGSTVTDAALCAVAENCTQLKNLEICRCPSVTRRGLLALAELCTHP